MVRGTCSEESIFCPLHLILRWSTSIYNTHRENKGPCETRWHLHLYIIHRCLSSDHQLQCVVCNAQNDDQFLQQLTMNCPPFFSLKGGENRRPIRIGLYNSRKHGVASIHLSWCIPNLNRLIMNAYSAVFNEYQTYYTSFFRRCTRHRSQSFVWGVPLWETSPDRTDLLTLPINSNLTRIINTSFHSILYTSWFGKRKTMIISEAEDSWDTQAPWTLRGWQKRQTRSSAPCKTNLHRIFLYQ
jgi:hypothetical protein